MPETTWTGWLTAEAPTSPSHAWAMQAYQAARTFVANPLAVSGLVIVLLLLASAALAPALATHDPLAVDLEARLQPISAEHWLGTDQLGRDIYSRIVYGSRVTLVIVALVAVIIGPLGMAIGVAAGYFGGTVDRGLMMLTDIVMAFPRLILALAFVAVLGPGLVNAVIAIAITGWPPYARVARAETLALRDREFVIMARLQGGSAARILGRYVAPLCLPSVIMRLTLDMAGIILIAAGLGFLGLGMQPPTAEWGAMVASGRNYLLDQWWVSTFPGIAIFVTCLGFNLLGDGLVDVFDPKR